MLFKKDDFASCTGALNVLLDNRIVLQGQIIHDCDEDRKIEHCSPHINVELENENVFITLELLCDALLINDCAELTVTSRPFFEGDIVRVNVAEISAIGPSHGCPEDDCECKDHFYYDNQS